ncbi:MAG: HAD-IIA family hydrolase [Solirubrobacterales bacterium]
MALADEYDGFLIDIDGVVLLGEDPLPGAVEALAKLAETGAPYAFVTNNPRLSGDGHAELLRRQGIEAADGQVVTSARTLISLVLEGPGEGSPAVVIGTDSFRRQVEEAGIEPVPLDEWRRAESVMVSGHEDFSYPELKAAAMAAREGALLGATGRDPTMPMPDGPWPGTGSILAAVETASGVEATVTGKPAPAIFEAALDLLGRPERVAMIGDRADTDVAGAQAVGIDGILVSRPGSEAAQPEIEWVDPDHRIQSVMELFE